MEWWRMLSPTRLEGMETWQVMGNLLIFFTVSDPP